MKIKYLEFICNGCNKAVTLAYHLKLKEDGTFRDEGCEQPFTCPICKHVYSRGTTTILNECLVAPQKFL